MSYYLADEGVSKKEEKKRACMQLFGMVGIGNRGKKLIG